MSESAKPPVYTSAVFIPRIPNQTQPKERDDNVTTPHDCRRYKRDAQQHRRTVPTDPHAFQELLLLSGDVLPGSLPLSGPDRAARPFANAVVYAFAYFFDRPGLGISDEEEGAGYGSLRMLDRESTDDASAETTVMFSVRYGVEGSAIRD